MGSRQRVTLLQTAHQPLDAATAVAHVILMSPTGVINTTTYLLIHVLQAERIALSMSVEASRHGEVESRERGRERESGGIDGRRPTRRGRVEADYNYNSLVIWYRAPRFCSSLALSVWSGGRAT